MRISKLLGLVVLSIIACVDAAPEPSALLGGPPTRPALGTQDVLVLVARVTAAAPPYTPSDAALATGADALVADVAAFLAAASHDQLGFDVDRRGPITLPASLCDPGGDAHDANQAALIAATVAGFDAAVDYTDVHQIVFLIDQDAPLCPLRSSGRPRAVLPIVTAEGPLDSSITFIAAFPGDSAPTLIHEYAHTIGGAHIEPRPCFDGGERVAIDHAAECAIGPPYLLEHDPLSNVAMRHFAMPRKLFWGWVPDDQLVTATETMTIVLGSTEDPRHAARAIRVPVAGSRYAAYVVEYRDGTGLDRGQAVGLYLYADRELGGSSNPELIDPPPYDDPSVFAARPLAIGGHGIGETYRDRPLGLSITLQATRGSQALVRVDAGRCTPGEHRGCCYSLTAPCDGRMTCGAGGSFGACQRCLSPFVCGFP